MLLDMGCAAWPILALSCSLCSRGGGLHKYQASVETLGKEWGLFEAC
jgi:hypothetical protein